MPSKTKLSKDETLFVQSNCMKMTDLEIATQLGRDVRTVIKCRKKLGVNKRQGGKIQETEQVTIHDRYNKKNIVVSKSMSDSQRQNFFKSALSNSLFFDTLKLQFTEEELNFYLEEWGSLCVQFEDVVATEKRQIDEYIKTSILGNRILRNIRVTEQEISLLQKEVIAYRAMNDMELEESQDRDTQLMAMIRSMSAQSSGMSNDYAKNVDQKAKLLDQLNARRRDRVDQIKKQGTTFMGLVALLREKTQRESIGRHMELVKMAKDKKKSEWHKPIVFEDGTRDCILVDQDSEFPEEIVVRLEDMRSSTISKYEQDKGKRILILEDDHRRIQFFQEVFKNHTIEFASSFMKAEPLLKENLFDLICLDYDIGLDKKGSEVAKYIVENDLQSDVLIHSMNQNGSKEMSEILNGKTNIEIMPFETIIRTTIKKED